MTTKPQSILELREELRQTLKHYYLYMKNCEIAGDSKISHTAVKGAINDANELNDKIVDHLLQAFAQFLKSIEWVENRTRTKDLDRLIKHELFQFDDNPRLQKLIAIGKINGYNKALDDCQKIVDDLIKELGGKNE